MAFQHLQLWHFLFVTNLNGHRVSSNFVCVCVALFKTKFQSAWQNHPKGNKNNNQTCKTNMYMPHNNELKERARDRGTVFHRRNVIVQYQSGSHPTLTHARPTTYFPVDKSYWTSLNCYNTAVSVFKKKKTVYSLTLERWLLTSSAEVVKATSTSPDLTVSDSYRPGFDLASHRL